MASESQQVYLSLTQRLLELWPLSRALSSMPCLHDPGSFDLWPCHLNTHLAAPMLRGKRDTREDDFSGPLLSSGTHVPCARISQAEVPLGPSKLQGCYKVWDLTDPRGKEKLVYHEDKLPFTEAADEEEKEKMDEAAVLEEDILL